MPRDAQGRFVSADTAKPADAGSGTAKKAGADSATGKDAVGIQHIRRRRIGGRVSVQPRSAAI